jgi:hypothetical protein
MNKKYKNQNTIYKGKKNEKKEIPNNKKYKWLPIIQVLKLT